MTFLILTTQRRADQLARVQEQLTLQMALLAEQKTAKIIEFIEATRRDLPWTKDHVDEEARAMSAPADPATMIDAIKSLTSEPEGDQAK
jgi:uncharacterized membrane protein